MPQYKVNVKWGKEKMSTELSTEESPEVFKLQLYSLTNVLPDRQKVMVKGMTLKDSWEGMKLKNGLTLLLLGSAEELPQAPEAKTKFVEDMTEDELNSALDMNTGLDNLGNTCYMNATIQMLSTVPEFSDALINMSASSISESTLMPGSGDPTVLGKRITKELGEIMKVLSNKDQVSMRPLMFLQYVYMRFPQFAEKNDRGIPMQQDANEFFSELLRLCQDNLPSSNGGSKTSFVDQFFGIEYANTLKCMDEEAASEEETHSAETSLQLNCFISQDIKFLMTGIKSKLKEEIEKNSPTLGRNAKYLKTSKISRLPGYLCVQMVRFFYKEKGNVNAKILKDVKFPIAFDAFELCTSELQERLKPVRDQFVADEEAKADAAISGKLADKPNLGQPKKAKMSDKKAEEKKEYAPYHFSEDVGSNSSGHYELQAIITHQGRSSSSGHYVAWLRVQADDWVKCDDNDVSPVTQEEVLKLSGGGDWHIAYLLLYGPRRLEKQAAKQLIDAQLRPSQAMEVEEEK